MKPQTAPTQLDNFLKQRLASQEGDLPAVDWAEMEVLLGSEKKSIPLTINKKQIQGVALVVLACAGIFGIYKSIEYFRSLPDDPMPAKELTKDSIRLVESNPQTIPSLTATDTIQMDSTALLEQKTDSVLNAADAFLKKINETAPPLAADILQKTDAKQKQKKKKEVAIPVDSSALIMPVEQLPPPDTSRKKTPEIKPYSTDTLKDAASPKSSRTKKGKNKKNNSLSDSSQPAPSKTDSVK